MQEVYEVKVKSRADASQLYPSERRYSASTVGGLGLVHLLLGATTFLLTALGLGAEEDAWYRYGGGVALGAAACAAAAGALLAWRRWYIDNNIRHFLVASVIAGVVAIVCMIVTVVALASLQQELMSRRVHAFNVDRRVPSGPQSYDQYLGVGSVSYDTASGVGTHMSTSDVDTWDADNSTVLDISPADFDYAASNTSHHQDVPRPTIFTGQETPSEEIRNVLLINILVASILEFIWCLLSAKISWKGMNSDYEGGEDVKRRVVEGAEKVKQRVRPDILHNVMKGSGGREMDVNLPQRESCVEYEERVRRFLASNNLQGEVAVVGDGRVAY